MEQLDEYKIKKVLPGRGKEGGSSLQWPTSCWLDQAHLKRHTISLTIIDNNKNYLFLKTSLSSSLTRRINCLILFFVKRQLLIPTLNDSDMMLAS